MKKGLKRTVSFVLAVIMLISGVLTAGMVSEVETQAKSFQYDYGVFIGVNPEDASVMDDYQTIVIDAAYYTKAQIKALKKQGHTVYSYLNIGSLETWRSYYKKFSNICLDSYENWEDEYWVDVTKESWQKYVVNTLAKSLKKKGVDGYFIDNVDVYYQYKTNAVYKSIKKMLKQIKKKYKKTIIINGGDTYVSKAIKKGGTLYFNGVNQECVYSRIKDYDTDTFGYALSSDRRYFVSYLKTCRSAGLSIYLLEYTTQSKLIEKIKGYCSFNGYYYYISDSVKLDG